MSDAEPAAAEIARLAETRDGRGWWGFAACLALVASLTAVAGPPGALAALATAVIWYAFATPEAVAAGHVALAALFPDGIALPSLALAEAGFVALVLASARRSSAPARFALVALASAFFLWGLARLVLESHPPWLAALALVGALALAGYGLHRFELVRTGLVSDESTTPDDT